MAQPPSPTPARPATRTAPDTDAAAGGGGGAAALPDFAGVTTVKEGGAAIEALLLAGGGVEEAAQRIAAACTTMVDESARPYKGDFLVLADDEKLDLAQAAAVRAEIEGIAAAFDSVRPDAGSRQALQLAGISDAINLIGGLLRTETEVTGLSHDAIKGSMLATAVAGKLMRRAILPAAAIALPNGSSTIFTRLAALVKDRSALATAADGMPADEAKPIRAAIERFDAFLSRVTTANADGKVPLVDAARLEAIGSENPLVLRVRVEKAGGSLIHRKNIWTFFGGDPLRVSGGLVASYTITDPRTGRVLRGEVLNCTTAVAKLSKVHSGQVPHAGAAAATLSSSPSAAFRKILLEAPAPAWLRTGAQDDQDQVAEAAPIELSIKVSDRKGVHAYGFAYDAVGVGMNGGKGTFRAAAGQTKILEWGMIGNPGGTMKVEVLRGSNVIYTREKSEIVPPFTEGIDAFEITVS